MKQIVEITRNSDNTVTVRVGRKIEHISVDGKNKSQLFDCVKYALIAKGISWKDVDIAELLK